MKVSRNVEFHQQNHGLSPGPAMSSRVGGVERRTTSDSPTDPSGDIAGKSSSWMTTNLSKGVKKNNVGPRDLIVESHASFNVKFENSMMGR